MGLKFVIGIGDRNCCIQWPGLVTTPAGSSFLDIYLCEQAGLYLCDQCDCAKKQMAFFGLIL